MRSLTCLVLASCAMWLNNIPSAYRLKRAAKVCIKKISNVVLLENPFSIVDYSTPKECKKLCRTSPSCKSALFFYNQDKCNLFSKESNPDNLLDAEEDDKSTLYEFKRGKECLKGTDTMGCIYKSCLSSPSKAFGSCEGFKALVSCIKKCPATKDAKDAWTWAVREEHGPWNHVVKSMMSECGMTATSKKGKATSAAPKKRTTVTKSKPTTPNPNKFAVRTGYTKPYVRPTKKPPKGMGFNLTVITNRSKQVVRQRSTTKPPPSDNPTESDKVPITYGIFFACDKSRNEPCMRCFASACNHYRELGSNMFFRKKTCCKFCKC